MVLVQYTWHVLGGHVQLVKTLVEEFGMSPDVRDNVSILTVHELNLNGSFIYANSLLHCT